MCCMAKLHNLKAPHLSFFLSFFHAHHVLQSCIGKPEATSSLGQHNGLAEDAVLFLSVSLLFVVDWRVYTTQDVQDVA